MERKSNCFLCGYFREERDSSTGRVRNYCNDKDCTVDPYDPECNYE